MQFRLWRAAAFVSSPIQLLCARFGVRQTNRQTDEQTDSIIS